MLKVLLMESFKTFSATQQMQLFAFYSSHSFFFANCIQTGRYTIDILIQYHDFVFMEAPGHQPQLQLM